MPVASKSKLTLYQFSFSHFNEKVRWGLDFKTLPSDRRNVLPGLHVRTAKKLTGKSQTPILVIDGKAMGETSDILRELERLQPDPRLFPLDQNERDDVDGWLEWLDEDLGPATRLALFHELLANPKAAAEMFTFAQPGWKSVPYSIMFPRIVPMLRDSMSINDQTAAEANEFTAKALDRIVDASRETGYLVGATFTAADLTAASLLSPLVFPHEAPYKPTDRVVAALPKWLAQWREHPGVEWCKGIYRRHRVAN